MHLNITLLQVKGISDVIFITDSSGCRLDDGITETIQEIIRDRNFIFRQAYRST